MEFSGEAKTFLSVLFTGAALGCVFDVYRVTRGAFKLRSFVTSAGDFLYWALAAAVVFSVLVAVNWGQVRFYVFIALFVGAAVYFRFCSGYVLGFLLRLIRIAARVKNSLERALRAVFLTVVAKPARFAQKTALKPLRFAGRTFKKIYRRFLPLPPEDKPPY